MKINKKGKQGFQYVAEKKVRNIGENVESLQEFHDVVAK